MTRADRGAFADAPKGSERAPPTGTHSEPKFATLMACVRVRGGGWQERACGLFLPDLARALFVGAE